MGQPPSALPKCTGAMMRGAAHHPDCFMATHVISEADFRQPILRKKSVTVRSQGTMRAEIDAGPFGRFVTDEPVEHGGSGEGPSPLQAVLGAMCGCETVTFRRTADDMNFQYSGIEFEGSFTIDIRGRMGMREVRPHFQTIKVQAVVSTGESETRLREVVEETEKRCPVFNLIKDAGVNLEVLWVRKAPQ